MLRVFFCEEKQKKFDDAIRTELYIGWFYAVVYFSPMQICKMILNRTDVFIHWINNANIWMRLRELNKTSETANCNWLEAIRKTRMNTLCLRVYISWILWLYKFTTHIEPDIFTIQFYPENSIFFSNIPKYLHYRFLSFDSANKYIQWTYEYSKFCH